MHIGNCHRQTADYFMEGQKLKKCYKEKDLGVLISSDLKVGAQCNQAFLKANRMLELIKQTITNKTPAVMLSLYQSPVRPHVKYCISA